MTEKKFQIFEFEDIGVVKSDKLSSLSDDCLDLLKKKFSGYNLTEEKPIQFHWPYIMKVLEQDDDLKNANIAINAQINISSKQDDILFYEQPTDSPEGHSGLCAQWNALFPIELKKNIKNANKSLNGLVTKAVTELQRDANHSKYGQAKFGLIGDGIHWIFTETHLKGSKTFTNLFIDDNLETVNYDSVEKLLKRIKTILLYIKENKPKLLSLEKEYKIGDDFVSKDFLFVNQSCGVIEFYNVNNPIDNCVFKFV